MLESDLQRLIQIEASKMGTILHRNNVALAWAGETVRVSSPGNIHMNPGDVLIRKARPIHAGLCVGSSDLIGWSVRNGMGIFTAIEVKTERGRVTQEQQNFIDAVKKAGGIGAIVRNLEDTREALK